jgi:hypothetical protein
VVDDNEHTRSNSAKIRLQREGIVESTKLLHDTGRQIITLSFGAVVLIGTFLRDIFPRSLGFGLIQVLIAIAFLGFIVSLITAVFSLFRSANLADLYKFEDVLQDIGQSATPSELERHLESYTATWEWIVRTPLRFRSCL